MRFLRDPLRIFRELDHFNIEASFDGKVGTVYAK